MSGRTLATGRAPAASVPPAPGLERKDPNILRSLQYFEAVARHGSLKRAAEDLGVTQSAVSHQIRRFSDAIGQQLMTRSGRGIVLTEAGQKLGERLTAAFRNLDGIVGELAGGGLQTVQLAVCSAFGPGWLIERLDDFRRLHPEIDLELHLHSSNPLLSGQVADAYVVADEVRDGFTSLPLMKERLLPVEAPRPKGRAGKKVARRLITTELHPGQVGIDWVDYCSSAGLDVSELQDGPFLRCSHYMLALQMARHGQGVALVPDFLAAAEIRSGTLALFNETPMPSGRTYRLCFRETRAGESKLVALADWFRNSMAEIPLLQDHVRNRKSRSRTQPRPAR